MAAEVALGRVGVILALEVSRLARNNADWYRLLDLCGITDTLIGDGDGLHHPGHFNDRLVLGLKGTMSEAELHILRARLDGGIKNKAARGELRRGLPVGFVWGDDDGEVRFDPDEAVTGAIRTVFQRFTETGSARQVWLWFRSEGLKFPSRSHMRADIRWITPTYRRSLRYSRIPFMPARMSMVKRIGSAMSMKSATSENACAVCPSPNGWSSFPTITRASSTCQLSSTTSG